MKVLKRDNSIVDFDQSRITSAIYKALKSCDMDTRWLAEVISDGVCKRLPLKDDKPLDVESIQDYVEEELILRGLTPVVRNYIIYRRDHKRAREAKQ